MSTQNADAEEVVNSNGLLGQGPLGFDEVMAIVASEEKSDAASSEPGAGGGGTAAANDPATGAGTSSSQVDGGEDGSETGGGRTAVDSTDGTPESDAGAVDEPSQTVEDTGGGSVAETAAASRVGTAAETWTATESEIVNQVGALATKVEDAFVQRYQESAFTEIREEHGKYFETLEKNPYVLVGTEVPNLRGEGMVVLQSTQEAKEWQEAARDLITEEIQSRAMQAMEGDQSTIALAHSSVQLFQNNPDLTPGSATFNVDLANRFAKTAKPYEVRDDDKKLLGYAIPVQPLIDQLRAETKPVSKQQAVAPVAQAKQAETRPQAAVQNKAGSYEESDDFSTLFGTLGLPDLKI